MTRILAAAVAIVAVVVGLLVGYVNYLCDRVDRLEAMLAAPAPIAAAAESAAETPAERRARYERLRQAWIDGGRAAEYVMRPGAIADPAPRSTP